jgi:hypothetical protein
MPVASYPGLLNLAFFRGASNAGIVYVALNEFAKKKI